MHEFLSLLSLIPTYFKVNSKREPINARVMHVKCMHELRSLLSLIPTYLHAMRCYNHVLH
jgi:hypothetical protein